MTSSVKTRREWKYTTVILKRGNATKKGRTALPNITQPVDIWSLKTLSVKIMIVTKQWKLNFADSEKFMTEEATESSEPDDVVIIDDTEDVDDPAEARESLLD